MKKNAYILSVDDEPLNQSIIQEFLDDKYELACVPTGPECLESIEKKKPDLLLLDIKMPLMSGLEVCRAIRLEKKYADLGIIILTASADEDTRFQAFNAGCDALLSKPFGLVSLVTTIEQHLNNKK